MDSVRGESVRKMKTNEANYISNNLTINGLTYTNDGIYYSNGKPFFVDGIIYYDPPDYVNVIRCRDCEYYRSHELIPVDDAPDICIRIPYSINAEPNGFCKWAKRKTN